MIGVVASFFFSSNLTKGGVILEEEILIETISSPDWFVSKLDW